MACKPASATDLPNELWVEIFKNVDAQSLLELSLVCKHWNRLIFKYMTHRLQLCLNAGTAKMPKTGTTLAPERIYINLHLTSFNIDGSPKHMKIFKKLAPNVQSLKLSQASLDFSLLIKMLKLCTRLKELYIKGVQLVIDDFNFIEMLKVATQIITADTTLDLDHKLNVFDKTYDSCILEELDDEELDEPRPIFPDIKSFGVDIDDLDSFEEAFLPCIPNVTELEIVVGQPHLSMIEKMAPRLKVLKVKVLQDAVKSFFTLRLPVLEVLVLTLNASFKNDDLKQFLLGCSTLKTLMIATERDEDLFPSIAEALPLVERLQISGETWTALEGLEKMTHLKEFALKGCHISSKCWVYFNSKKDPAVKTLECIGVMYHDLVYDVLSRMLNVERLVLSVREVHDMTDFTNGTGWLKDFTLLIDRIHPYILEQLQELGCLQRLVIKAAVFDEKHFPLLEKVIVLEVLKHLQVVINKGEGQISPDIARRVASANRSCMFMLNGERVEPEEPEESVHPASGGEKRKLSPGPDEASAVAD